MKGIREAAMGTEEEKPVYHAPIYPTYPRQPLFDNYNGFDDGFDDGYGYRRETYKPTKEEIEKRSKEKEKTITIIITVPESKLTEALELYYGNYDYEPVKNQAIVIAYDKLISILGKNFEQKYSTMLDADEGYGDVEVTAVLKELK